MDHDSTTVIGRLREILDAVKDPLADDWDPIEVGLLISKLEHADLDLVHQQNLFASFVKQVEEGLPRNSSLREQTKHILRVFSQDLQFQGDKSNYYNIKNSFLSDVFLRRKGIPITLSLVFMGICRSLGFKALGISFPGHFLVRMAPTKGHFEAMGDKEVAEDWRSQWFIDCFDSGAILSVQDCERRLLEWTRGVLPFGPEVLKVAHPVEIVSRILRNLRAIFSEKEDLPRLYWVLSALIDLCPQDATDSYRERGLLFGRMGRFGAACDDFKKFLSLSTDLEKKRHVESLMRLFESQQELAN